MLRKTYISLLIEAFRTTSSLFLNAKIPLNHAPKIYLARLFVFQSCVKNYHIMKENANSINFTALFKEYILIPMQ